MVKALPKNSAECVVARATIKLIETSRDRLQDAFLSSTRHQGVLAVLRNKGEQAMNLLLQLHSDLTRFLEDEKKRISSEARTETLAFSKDRADRGLVVPARREP